ncbi:MAG: UvrD-helicase domain-containing protein [Thermoguttaceae bacterium]|nr:UvrD-helicase domain-containing protein [Thermoguttaceae bacterium]
MKTEEIELIQSKHNAAIIAPAGHGKTEMITELVDKLPGKKLVLTHTNAGVSALTQRLKRKQVDSSKYNLSTISAFCMKWCSAYPMTAEIDTRIQIADKRFFNEQNHGLSNIFSHLWAREILQNTYSCVLVDEYQDCIIEQHKIFLEINKTLPVYILGDPLQAIFGWAGKLVSWDDISFELVSVETEPYRWKHTNIELGRYLTSVRESLKPALRGVSVKLFTNPNGSFIRRINPENIYEKFFLDELTQYRSILYISKWPKTQLSFSQRSGGEFQNDEPQNLNDLYDYAQTLDTDDVLKRASAVYSIIRGCATRVNEELGSYEKHILDGNFDFSKITKHQEFGRRLLELYQKNGYNEILCILDWVKSCPTLRLFRRELYTELLKAIRLAIENKTTVYEEAQRVRMTTNNQYNYYGFKKLSSRTVLSKGLEFECVLINLKERYTATDMYVAMTRATKVIYFITDQDFVLLNAPKRI